MELQLTDEQGMLAESVRELIGRRSGDDGVVPAESEDPLWRELRGIRRARDRPVRG